MKSFWTDTPFGITLLASIVLTMITSMCILSRIIVRVRAGNAVDDNGMKLAAYLVSFAVMMVGVTYAAILVYYLSGGVLDLIEAWYSLSFSHLVWVVVRIWAVGVWLGTAALIFRRMFRRWL
jgi:hypothetical protein